jgi:hypothetical protein
MTYNFDLDRWYENQKRRLDARRAAGEIDDRAWQELIDDLDRRYDDLQRRLDGPFELPEP